ncbi:TIGR04141 family sporadically distributed protein [Nonomuraea cavernae]|uniref:TIGR04141 family sporadically distributed protein n=1 Tax=Nonomuraea cavernae TaxID=2045107 RepID=UPI0033D94791
MTSTTAKRTLYRLKGIAPTIEAMCDALDMAQLISISADLEILTDEFGVPAILIDGVFAKTEASWYADLRRTSRRQVSRPCVNPASLLMFALDDEVYAIGYGLGHHLIADRLKDKRFGLRFAIRQVNPAEVNDLVRQTPGSGKTDITLVPGGASVRTFGIEEHAQIVRTIGGRLDGVKLTVSSRTRARVSSAHGGVGLRLHLGVEGSDLLSDAREISRICREERPHPDLEFVEHITEVVDAALIARLAEALDDLLGQPDEGRVAGAVPQGKWDHYLATRAFRIRINSRQGQVGDTFNLPYLLDRLRVQRAGTRVTALSQGKVVLYDDSRTRSDDVIWFSSALRWVEADVALDDRRFFLLDEDWYEIGPAYLATVRDRVQKLIVSSATDDLPAWDLAHDEHRFCEDIENFGRGYLCMDKKLVKTRLHRGNGVEICDVLFPDGTLMMAKRAHRAGALSHLFKQVLVAVQALQHDPEAVAGFRERVAQAPGGWSLPEGFQPKRVVLAILLKDGTELTADTLFPFAQVALLHTATVLRAWGVTIEVVGVRSRPCACGVQS